MKRRIKNWKLMKQVIKDSGANKLLGTYMAFFLISSVIIWLVDPEIQTMVDSLWYCFAAATTIGFGDVYAKSLIARIFTVVLSLYSIVIVAVITAVITNFYMEIAKARANESIMAFLDDLENLPELSLDELVVLSEKVKHWKIRKSLTGHHTFQAKEEPGEDRDAPEKEKCVKDQESLEEEISSEVQEGLEEEKPGEGKENSEEQINSEVQEGLEEQISSEVQEGLEEEKLSEALENQEEESSGECLESLVERRFKEDKNNPDE